MRRRIGSIDIDTLQTILLRLASIGTGGVTLLVIPYTLSTVEQGYYYTILSLLALQVFFELGFNYVLVQLSSHEFAKVEVMARFDLAGDPRAIDRLASLYRLVSRWYLVASFGFLAVVWTGGLLFFRQSHPGSELTGAFVVAWSSSVAATAVNLYVSPFLAILEGAGNVAAVARMRLFAAVSGYVLMWSLLVGGLGLLAIPSVPLTLAVWSIAWLRYRGNVLHGLRRLTVAPGHGLDWRADIFPFQWRISLSWIGGYLIYQLFNPFVFRFQGPVEAGRVGMALAIFTAVQTVGMSWVTAKYPTFANLVARDERGELNSLFRRVTVRSVISTATMCLVVVAGIALLTALSPAAAARLVSAQVALSMTVATVANTLIFAAATYMRSHKEEPMVAPTIVSGVLMVAGLYFGSMHGVGVTIGVYAAIATFVMLPWTLLLLRRFYR